MFWRQRFFNRLFRRTRKVAKKLPAFVLLFSLIVIDGAAFLQGSAVFVKQAQAAIGDFSIFRNASDNTAIPSGGSIVQVSWDTIVTENATIDLLGDNTTIDLVDGGKYLVMYNVWAEDTFSGTNNRRSFETWLTLNDSELAYGRGDGYIRDASDDDQYAYAAGAAIIDASAGDDLVINIARDDTNADNNVDIRAGVNGVSIVRMSDDFDYARLQKVVRSSDISPNTDFTATTWDTTDELDTGSFSFSPTSEDIVLTGDDGQYYLTTVNVRLNQDASNSTRQNYEMRLTLNDEEVPGTLVTGYPRGNPNSNGIYNATLVYSGLVRKTSASNQTLNVEVRRSDTGTNNISTDIVGGETAISMAALPTYADFISLTSTTSQPAASSQAPIDFDEQIEVDSDAFSHNDTVNPSRIEFDANGDYLFFSTVYTSRTSSGDRDPFRVEWRLDGTNTLGYGGHGSFNRGDQGSQDAYTSGSSGGLILNGITDTQYLEVTVFDEEDTSQSDMPAGGIAVQGVEIGGLFQTDIEVSATGTQTVNADITTSNLYLGGAFVIQEENLSRNLTTINITESGTVDAENGLNNIELYYDLDTSVPYDCSSESYSGAEAQFGSTDTNGFSGADGISSFTDVLAVSPTQAICVYVVLDVTGSSTDADTIDVLIANPTTDLTFTGGPSISPATTVSPAGVTTLQNAELTQVHYQWLEDDGGEGAASSVNGSEDTTAIGFANGSIRRLRMQVSAEGSTSSNPVQLRLDYAERITTCSAATSWTDVGAVGGDWDMSDSTFIIDGADSSDLAVGSGGTTNENSSFLSSNGALKDTSSLLGALTFGTTNFLEAEFAIEPTLSAPQGTTYCFRLSDNGTDLRNYDVYPEATLSADVTVDFTGTQIATIDIGSTSAYVGGQIIVTRDSGSETLTSLTVHETGTVDATNVLNPILYYDLDTSVPYDCSSESYSATDSSVSGSAFLGSNGSTTFTLSESVGATQAFCGYLVIDVDTDVSNDETIVFEITSPDDEVVVSSSSVAPTTPVSPSGETVIAGPILTQIHYHWRNDDGSESAATSATGDTEDSPLTGIPQLTPYRLRLAVSNEGTVQSQSTTFRLEYGTKVTTCDAVASWIDVGATDGAWDMAISSNIADGNTTNIAAPANGAVTDENSTFVGTGALRETTSETSAFTLQDSEFTELEFSIAATLDSGFATDYCFRVTDQGTPLLDYQVYAELTTREKQDFFVQRGESDVPSGGLTLTAGVDYEAPSATSSVFVRITNNNHTGSGRTDTAQTNQTPNNVTAYISDQSDVTSSFTIGRAPSASTDTRVAWEIVEFIGTPGTDNEIVVRDVGTQSISFGDFFATTSPISGVADADDVVVFVTGQMSFAGSASFYNDGLVTAEWSSTTDEAVFQRGDEDTDMTLSYAVVEFTGQNWNVQRVEHQYTAAGAAEVEAIEAIPSVSKGFIHAQKRAGEGQQGLDEFGHQVFLSSLGAVTFQLRSTASTPADHVSVAWVISNSQSGDGEMTVYQSSGTGFTGFDLTSTSISFVADPGVDTSNASLFANHDTAGTGTAYPRAIHSFFLASSTAFEIWRNEDGQPTDYRVEVVEWPVADTGVRQNYYRFYVDNDAVEPTDPWPAGASDLGENFAITSSDDPIGEGERVRIRMSLAISNSSLPQNTLTFKLQYGQQVTTCSAVTVWNDVGAPGSGSVWRGFDGTPIDGTELATSSPAAGTLKLSLSDVAGSYEEQNDSAVNPYSVGVGEDVEYDWLIEHNGASQRTDYCFRMVENDGSTLDGYQNYPTLRTTGYTPVITDWRWYDDETNVTPATPLAAENVTPVDTSNGDIFKLRTVVSEVESAIGVNVKFALQYSQFSDFSDGGSFVTSTSSCMASSTWCYSDGGGDDNDLIPSAILSSADSCIAGVGNGCGTHNENPDNPSTLSQPSNSNMEFEFTLQQGIPSVNTVYYFRLYETGAGDPVTASTSFPSLTTAGAELTFSVDGVEFGQTIAGIVTDATTTANTIEFPTLTFGTSYEAAQSFAINTNATEGYQLLLYADQQLTNSYGDVIPAITSTNATPAGWDTACDSAALGCFGYHTTDATLSGGSSRFSPIDSYAAITTEPAEVIYSSIPEVGSETIVFRIEFSQLQPAGIYEMDLVYVAVPVF